MAISKQDLIDRLIATNNLTLVGWGKLVNGCSMAELFALIGEIEEQMVELRALTVKHSKELAAHNEGVAGRRRNGKPDRRYKAAKRV